MIATTPKPPYYAVIFTSIRTENDKEGYGKTANRMVELALQMPGCLGAESAREEVGITVSYWQDLESIKNWKYQMEHVEARDKGREIWYSKYKLRIALVERDYEFSSKI